MPKVTTLVEVLASMPLGATTWLFLARFDLFILTRTNLSDLAGDRHKLPRVLDSPCL